MTDARKKELEARRPRRVPTRLPVKAWRIAGDVIIIAIPVLLVVDGLILKAGILYSPYLSLFNPFDDYLQIVGLATSFVGLVILVIAGKTIEENVYAKASEERALLTTGIFAYIRHPLYLSFILVPIGFILVSLNILSILIFAALTIVTNGDLRECDRQGKFTFITTATKCEEMALIKIYGQKYEEYMKRTGRLFPKIR
ncbi:MAG: methyltransferase family protein [Candidatus Thorarchaeota archaeon]